jgi:hypothetical protein
MSRLGRITVKCCRFRPDASSASPAVRSSDRDERQPGESHERRLLRHLFHRDMSHGKHRDPVLPVNLEHSLGVLDDDLPIKVTATNNKDRVDRADRPRV